jgi:hypothetical protein
MEDAAPKISRSRRPKVEINEEPEIQAIPARPRSRARKEPEPPYQEPPEPEPAPVEEFKIVKTRKPRKNPSRDPCLLRMSRLPLLADLSMSRLIAPVHPRLMNISMARIASRTSCRHGNICQYKCRTRSREMLLRYARSQSREE